MKNSTIQKALKRIDDLKDELAKLEQFVSLHRELFEQECDGTIEVTVKTLASAPVKKWTSAEIVEEAMKVLADRMRPMKLGELYEAVIQKGVRINGKNPKNNFGAMLSADKVCLSTGPNGWWFKDEAPPRRLYEFEEYEEGPALEATRPSQLNGTAGWSPASPGVDGSSCAG